MNLSGANKGNAIIDAVILYSKINVFKIDLLDLTNPLRFDDLNINGLVQERCNSNVC